MEANIVFHDNGYYYSVILSKGIIFQKVSVGRSTEPYSKNNSTIKVLEFTLRKCHFRDVVVHSLIVAVCRLKAKLKVHVAKKRSKQCCQSGGSGFRQRTGSDIQ